MALDNSGKTALAIYVGVSLAAKTATSTSLIIRTTQVIIASRSVLENKPATISRDETCGRKLLAGI